MKNRLYTPGPTEVPHDVLTALGEAPLHHRTDEFKALFREVTDNLTYTFQTAQEPLILTASGSGAMEMTVANLFSCGDTVAVVVAGKFGERWRDIGLVYGLDVRVYDVEWGDAPDPAVLRQWLGDQGNVRGLFLTHSETSTGTIQDVRRIVSEVSDLDPLIVVDAITSLGVHDLKPDDWGLDAVVSGSQKAFMCPPGLAFLSFSDRAWEAAERSDLPKYYFSAQKARESQAKDLTPYTPAVPLFVAMAVSLRRIREEGIEAIVERHAGLGRATRAGVQAIGLELFSKHPSNGLTAILGPKGIDAEKIRSLLAERHGIRVAGGQAELKGKIFRIGHMGYYDHVDILAVLGALESVLAELGHTFPRGAGVAAAQESGE